MSAFAPRYIVMDETMCACACSIQTLIFGDGDGVGRGGGGVTNMCNGFFPQKISNSIRLIVMVAACSHSIAIHDHSLCWSIVQCTIYIPTAFTDGRRWWWRYLYWKHICIQNGTLLQFRTDGINKSAFYVYDNVGWWGSSLYPPLPVPPSFSPPFVFPLSQFLPEPLLKGIEFEMCFHAITMWRLHCWKSFHFWFSMLLVYSLDRFIWLKEERG